MSKHIVATLQLALYNLKSADPGEWVNLNVMWSRDEADVAFAFEAREPSGESPAHQRIAWELAVDMPREEVALLHRFLGQVLATEPRLPEADETPPDAEL